MTIEKGKTWGTPGALPADGVVCRSDAEARAALEAARGAGRPYPVLGLLGGDLCRTLGGRGDEGRLRSETAVTFPVDLGQVLADGRLSLFIAHVVARSWSWRRTVVALNAQWLGGWNVGPRSHPNDGLVDVYDAHLRFGDLAAVRARLPTGSHLPHPRIRSQRSAAATVELDRSLPVWVDGVRTGPARTLAVRVEPDAVRVVVAP